MLRIKILDNKNHPFAYKIKVCEISIEVILLTFFILIVMFVTVVYIKGHSNKKEPATEAKAHPLK